MSEVIFLIMLVISVIFCAVGYAKGTTGRLTFGIFIFMLVASALVTWAFVYDIIGLAIVGTVFYILALCIIVASTGTRQRGARPSRQPHSVSSPHHEDPSYSRVREEVRRAFEDDDLR